MPAADVDDMLLRAGDFILILILVAELKQHNCASVYCARRSPLSWHMIFINDFHANSFERIRLDFSFDCSQFTRSVCISSENRK